MNDARDARNLFGTIHIPANCSPDKFIEEDGDDQASCNGCRRGGRNFLRDSRRARRKSVGVGVGPAGVGVTVGRADRDRYRDREVIREREYRDRDETVVIKRKRDYDPDRKVIIERERY